MAISSGPEYGICPGSPAESYPGDGVEAIPSVTRTSILLLSAEEALLISPTCQSMQLAEGNATRRNLDLTDNVNEKLAKTLEIAEHSNIAFEELKEEISRQSSMGVSFWRYLEFAGTCQSAFDYVASLRAKQLDPV